MEPLFFGGDSGVTRASDLPVPWRSCAAFVLLFSFAIILTRNGMVSRAVPKKKNNAKIMFFSEVRSHSCARGSRLVEKIEVCRDIVITSPYRASPEARDLPRAFSEGVGFVVSESESMIRRWY